MIAFSCQDIRKSETVKMNTFQKNKSMQIERSKSTCRFENHLTKDQQKHTNFICQKIIKKFRLISKLNLGWLVNLIYVNFWPKFQSVNQQIYVNFDISKITNLRDSRYIEEKIKAIPINRNRKRQRYSRCTAEEINQMRTLIGGLAWVSKETRPDISGRVALLQQTMPHPMIKDLVESNSLAEELRKNPGLGIRVQPIPLERLRVGVITDASWGNAGTGYLETNDKDFWEETETSWVRHHLLPRRLSFHPGAAPHGPDLHSISRTRTTWTEEGFKDDRWDGMDGIREYQTKPWTGTTTFLKSDVEAEINKPINERFLQLSKQHSQGGYILIYYDSNLEITDQLEMVTIASWKSYKLKRCTVNTLSAECQSMLQGIGSLHWHRYLLVESFGCHLQLGQWENQLKEVPFIAVTDSRSLYDTITKCRNTSAHIDDKRTAIDLTILKGDLEKTKGQVRWVGGSNMVSDSLTKKMTPGFLRKIMFLGRWSLTETGYKKLLDIHALFNIKCGRWRNVQVHEHFEQSAITGGHVGSKALSCGGKAHDGLLRKRSISGLVLFADTYLIADTCLFENHIFKVAVWYHLMVTSVCLAIVVLKSLNIMMTQGSKGCHDVSSQHQSRVVVRGMFSHDYYPWFSTELVVFAHLNQLCYIYRYNPCPLGKQCQSFV